MNTEKLRKYLVPVAVLLIVLLGFIYRYYSISHNLSYWNDESNVAIFSRGILEYGKPVNANNVGYGVYEILLFYVTALSYMVFGVTEFAGRLPSVIAGTLLIGVLYAITKQLIHTRAALIAAFLGAFLQVQMAWSTQLRPYIWLQLFTVLVLYYTYRFLINKEKFIDKNIFLAGTFSFIAALFHGTGMMSSLIIGFAVMYKALEQKQYKYIAIPFILLILSFILAYFSIAPSINNVIAIITMFHFDPLHYRIYLTNHYGWLIAGSLLGGYSLWQSNKKLFFLLIFSVIVIFNIAIFKLHPRYTRYSLPAFPLLYILFGAGMVWTIDKIKKYIPFKYNSAIAAILVLGIFFAFPLYKGKIILFPQKYYSINADMRENPIVNYKEAFAKIEKLIEGKEKVIVMDAWNDRVPWYLPKQEFIWLVKNGNGKFDPVYGERMIGTIKGFEQVKSQYPAGIVIVENWQSQTPPELQDHVRSTLKFEFTQGTVPGNEKDPWSISVYSWGL